MTLRTQLSDLAADAPDPGALDLGLLRGRITRRRRGRLAAAGGAVLATVAAVGTAAAVLLAAGDGPAEPPVATPEPVQQAYAMPVCGEPVRSSGPAPHTSLELDVRPETPLDPGDDAAIGSATVTNTGDVPIGGSDILEAWIARDGVVVTDLPPVATVGHSIELAPGESMTYTVASFVRQCTSRGPSQPDQRPLEPGTYQLYVQLRLLDLDGTRTTVFRGPIDVEVR